MNSRGEATVERIKNLEKKACIIQNKGYNKSMNQPDCEFVGVTIIGKPLKGFGDFTTDTHYENGKTYYNYRIEKRRLSEALNQGCVYGFFEGGIKS